MSIEILIAMYLDVQHNLLFSHNEGNEHKCEPLRTKNINRGEGNGDECEHLRTKTKIRGRQRTQVQTPQGIKTQKTKNQDQKHKHGEGNEHEHEHLKTKTQIGPIR